MIVKCGPSLALSVLIALTPAHSTGAQSPIAIVNVNVIPMDRERVLEGQTVLVRAGRIETVGSATTVSVPPGYVRVDGTGKFLMPGLTEMHSHIPFAPAPDSTVKRVLALYVLNGVTTVRGMFGHASHLELRRLAELGEILSPRIYAAGPSLNGTSVPTVAAAIKSVSEQKAAGFDLLKIHPGIKREVFDSLAATADRLGIRFAGHVPLDVGIRRAIASKYWTVEHIDGYLEGLYGNGEPVGLADDGFFGLGLVDQVDVNKLPALVGATRVAGVWVTPTETLFETIAGTESIDAIVSRPEMKYWPQQDLDQWKKAIAAVRNDPKNTPARRQRFLELRRLLIKSLHDGGVRFVLGSDSPQIGNVPGFSIAHELQLVVAAGLTPYEALASGTRNVAEMFKTINEAGTVEPGKRADLLLLDANPLRGIGAVSRINGVVLKGRWLGRSEIDQRLAALAASH